MRSLSVWIAALIVAAAVTTPALAQTQSMDLAGQGAIARPVAWASEPSSDRGAESSQAGSLWDQPGLYAGVDFLFLRPTFSEAIAFARGVQTPSSFAIEGRELQFEYNPSFRIVGGYRFGDGDGAIEFSYSHFDAVTEVNGTVSGPGEFLVDPFGNLVGAAAVIDPRDNRFGNILVGGDLIRTRATVTTNIYDIDFIRPFSTQSACWTIDWSAGVRIADINQFYSSTITAGGDLLSYGDFSTDFIGAGPRLGLRAKRQFGQEGRFSIFGSAHGSLLLGEYDVASGNTVTAPAQFSASQLERLTRTIPVLETELGAAWRIGDSLVLSAGWMFQSWFDLGTSGGTFGGFFTGGDDANIMSFDGLFAKAVWTF